jgi:hypothetical protein
VMRGMRAVYGTSDPGEFARKDLPPLRSGT